MSCVVALLVALLGAAPPLEEVNRAVKATLADERVQSSFPGEAESPAGPTPEATPTPPRRASPPPGASPLFEVLLWTLAAVAVLLGGLWLARNLGGRVGEVGVATPAGEAVPRATPAAAALADAQALAREGRYADAVHALLLAALAALGGRANVPGSWTSREVLRETRVAPAARDAVADLVEAVELSHFGGRALGRADYEAGAKRYLAFLDALEPAS